MNFINFLTSGASLINSSLQEDTKNFQKETNILVSPAKESENVRNQKECLQQLKGFQSCQAKQDTNQSQQQLKKLLLNQEQMIINQYLQLSYLTKQLQEKQKEDKGNKEQTILKNSQSNEFKEEDSNMNNPFRSKKIKKVNRCGHEDKAHYAKGMCNNCYHKYGRTKKPWNCPHKKLYAAGMCQNCYINGYNKKKRQEKQQEMSQEIKEEIFQQIKKTTNEANKIQDKEDQFKNISSNEARQK